MRTPLLLDRRTLLAGLAGLATMGLVTSCTSGNGSAAEARVDTDRRAPGELADVPDTVASFTSRLTQGVTQPGANLVASPLSVLIALAMTRNGAAGQTATEMDEVLEAADLAAFNEGVNTLSQALNGRSGTFQHNGEDAEVTLNIANSLWSLPGYEFEEAFLTTLAEFYGAGMNLVDFGGDPTGSAEAINGWTSDATAGKIEQIVGPDDLTAETRLVLVNAIHLKAPWLKPFSESATEARPFTRADGEVVQPDTMVGSAEAYHEDAVCRAASKKFVGEQLAMALVEPTGTIDDTLAHWADGGLTTLLDGLAPARVDLQLPKWTFEWKAELKGTLGELGMPTAMTDRADFSGMTETEQLMIAFILHRAVIEVDEIGAEAAAATAVGAGVTSAPVDEPEKFVFDKPYLYVIHDVETRTPLFIGRVEDPTVAQG
ncbi:serpin family protein [Microlunatus sp. Y2014]|uniref:serpin family protein n=1 Tax=Microlunatus sp. Y2014 TaxID=3418488 RepID=UPI003DA77771